MLADPIIIFGRIGHECANMALTVWGHYLGPACRPFGRQSFGLRIEGNLVAVAISESTTGTTCAGFPRREVVELSRLCSDPSHRDMTRVALRLWRTVAPAEWGREQWPVRALVSYSHRNRHDGDIYRADGWIRVGHVRGGKGGGTRAGNKVYEPKAVWAWPLDEGERDELRAAVKAKGGPAQ